MAFATAATVLASAAPAAAETSAHLDEVPVTAAPGCAGTTSSEAMVAPLQQGDRMEKGVRVAVHFSSDNHDSSCVLQTRTEWRNLDTGASGIEDIAVPSTADPASGGHYGTSGYASKGLWTGPGRVVATVSTHPGAELQVTV